MLIYDNVWLIGWYTSFANTTGKPTLWAGKVVKGRKEEWTDTAKVIGSDVTGLCGFWDGSCERGTCGAGIMIQVFTETLGWLLFTKSADSSPSSI